MTITRIFKATIAGFVVCAMSTVQADQQFSDDLIVQGSICGGLDCVNGESFGFDTLRLKENNVRIKLIDTSGSSSFPTHDWEITANDSINGGLNRFSIFQVDSNQTPFTILSGASDHSLYIGSNGNIGLGTSAPQVDVHLTEADTPTIRLEQTSAAGFAAQNWDIGGNETNFFIRDNTNGSQLPFRIVPNAPNNSLFIAADGDVGFETSTPVGIFDIAHANDANNHAILVDPTGQTGINIDNGFLPRGLLEVQTTGGISRFIVAPDGEVGIGTSGPGGIFDVRKSDGTAGFIVDPAGKVGIATSTPAGIFDVHNATGSVFLITSEGDPEAGTVQVSGAFAVTGNMLVGGNINVAETAQLISPEITVTTISTTSPDGIIQVGGNLNVAGVVTQTSDRNMKDNILNVNTTAILEAVMQLGISSWSYKSDKKVQHIGPMAQDFRALFGLGKDEKTISTLDLSGIALASIQELNHQVAQKEEKITTLEIQVENLSSKLHTIEKLLQTLINDKQ
jgi:hypothetical protein